MLEEDALLNTPQLAHTLKLQTCDVVGWEMAQKVTILWSDYYCMLSVSLALGL